MLERMWSNRNSHTLLVEMQNGTATLEDNLAVYIIKLNTVLPHNPAIALLGYLPKGVKNSCTLLCERKLFAFLSNIYYAFFNSTGLWKTSACVILKYF